MPVQTLNPVTPVDLPHDPGARNTSRAGPSRPSYANATRPRNNLPTRPPHVSHILKEIYNHPGLGRYAVPSKLNVPHLGRTSITYCDIPDETSVVQFIHAIDTQIGAVMLHRTSFSNNKGKSRSSS
ncbi:hypothetical protein BGZ98_005690, partial [Dissophora globulifera]